MSATSSDPRYPGAGSGALVDGRLGSGDFRDGQWLAYDGVDFEATLDLGDAFAVSRVGLDCLQNQAAWILLPGYVVFAVSDDGVRWRELPPIERPSEPDSEVRAELLATDVGGHPVRYVRVKARGHEVLPSWHPGFGNSGWVFLDEVVVLA